MTSTMQNDKTYISSDVGATSTDEKKDGTGKDTAIEGGASGARTTAGREQGTVQGREEHQVDEKQGTGGDGNATKSPKMTGRSSHDGQTGTVAQTVPSGPRDAVQTASVRSVHPGARGGQPNTMESARRTATAPSAVARRPVQPDSRSTVPPTEPRAQRPPPTEPRAQRPPPTEPRAQRPPPTEPRAERRAPTQPRAQRPGPTEQIRVDSRASFPPGGSQRRARSPTDGKPQSSSVPAAKRARMSSPERKCGTQFLPVVYQRDPAAELSQLEDLTRSQAARIRDLETKLVVCNAQFHIFKKYGPGNRFNQELVNRYERKFRKAITGDSYGDVSDISDDEPVAGPRLALVPREVLNGDERGDFAFSEDDMRVADGDLARAKDSKAPQKPLDELVEALYRLTGRVDYRPRALHVLYLCTGYGQAPAPVGRYGQPFFRGSAWEDFDPRRLFKSQRDDYVPFDSHTFSQLLADATWIPFLFRSHTQRLVVSWGIDANHAMLNKWAEPDVLSLCRKNPSRLPPAVRRQYRRDAAKKIFYAEYSAVDLDSYIFITQAGPCRWQGWDDYQGQKRSWLEYLDYCLIDWLPNHKGALGDELNGVYDQRFEAWSADLVSPKYSDDEIYQGIIDHLKNCGATAERLLPGGALYGFVHRARGLQREVLRLSAAYDKVTPRSEANQDRKREWVADRLGYFSIPKNSAVVRTRLLDTEVAVLAQKHAAAGYDNPFVPFA